MRTNILCVVGRLLKAALAGAILAGAPGVWLPGGKT